MIKVGDEFEVNGSKCKIIAITQTTITFRNLRWYERMWGRVRFWFYNAIEQLNKSKGE